MWRPWASRTTTPTTSTTTSPRPVSNLRLYGWMVVAGCVAAILAVQIYFSVQRFVTATPVQQLSREPVVLRVPSLVVVDPADSLADARIVVSSRTAGAGWVERGSARRLRRDTDYQTGTLTTTTATAVWLWTPPADATFTGDTSGNFRAPPADAWIAVNVTVVPNGAGGEDLPVPPLQRRTADANWYEANEGEN